MSKLHLFTRAASTFLRFLELLIAGLVLGIFSYYLATLSRRSNSTIPTWTRAVEGMSGAAVIYTAFAVVLTCAFGGITFFAFIAVILDICFVGCFIAIAVLTRGGDVSCSNTNDNSPIGTGEHLSCQLQRAVFAVSIAGAILFLLSALLQIALFRSHKRENRYGPSPSNNYTSGSGARKPWQRNRNRKTPPTTDAELGTLGTSDPKHPHDRPSADTAVTGTTAHDGYGGPVTKYAEPTLPAQSTMPGTMHAPQVGMGVGAATGAGYASHIPEMEAGAPGGRDRPYVTHDAQPEAEVHQGGYVHSNPEAQTFSRGYAR